MSYPAKNPKNNSQHRPYTNLPDDPWPGDTVRDHKVVWTFTSLGTWSMSLR